MHRSFQRDILAAALAATLALAGGSALAGTVTGNLPVSATVIPVCYIETIDPLVFNNVDTTSHGTSVDANSRIVTTCTAGAVYDVSFAGGNNANGAPQASGARTMVGGTSGMLLPYRLYRDTARIDEIAVGAVGLAQLTSAGHWRSDAFYGRLVAAEFKVGPNWPYPADSYTDTVVMTVTF